MAVVISVPYGILLDSGIEEGQDFENGPTATVKFQCSWANRYTLNQDLCGRSYAAGNQIVRIPPFAYPANTTMYCLATEIRGYGDPTKDATGWLTYSKAQVTARFSRPSFDFNDLAAQEWTTISTDYSAEFMTLPNSTYRFGDGTPTNSPIGKRIGQIGLEVKRHWLPFIPHSEMANLSGKINSAAYVLGGYSYPAGYLLFVGGRSDLSVETSGNLTYDLSYRFIARSVPWNYYFHPNRTTGFAEVTDGNGAKVYSEGDFSTLP